jgi:PAS domain S-box-containing protein
MSDDDAGTKGRAAGAARRSRSADGARIAALEAENAALRRALALAGTDADTTPDRRAQERSREGRAGRADDAPQADMAAAATARAAAAQQQADRDAALRRATTALAESRAALREREERLHLVLDSAADYAIFTTDLARRVTSWNAGAERLLGWSREEILGRPADVIFTPEDQAAGVPARVSADLNRARSERRAAAAEAARERERHRRTAEEAVLASEALKAAIGALEKQVERGRRGWPRARRAAARSWRAWAVLPDTRRVPPGRPVPVPATRRALRKEASRWPTIGGPTGKVGTRARPRCAGAQVSRP